jgi:hypothetical protein
MKTFHAAALAALMIVGAAGGASAGHQMKGKAAHNMAASKASMYECTHCKIKMTAKAAKAHGMKCDCGMKLTMVKPMKSKKA